MLENKDSGFIPARKGRSNKKLGDLAWLFENIGCATNLLMIPHTIDMPSRLSLPTSLFERTNQRFLVVVGCAVQPLRDSRRDANTWCGAQSLPIFSISFYAYLLGT